MLLHVLENKKEAQDIHILKIEKPENFNILPGQFVTLSPNGVARAYSVANYPEDENYLEFCIKHVPCGKVSPVLCSLKPGNALTLAGPFGDFTLSEKSKNLLFICTGTGIAPIKAMLEYIEKKRLENEKRIKLIYGNENEKSIAYLDYLKKWKNKENFEMIITLTNPSRKWKGEKGLVHNIIQKNFNSLKKFEIYICGSPKTVIETKKICESLKARTNRIKYETCILMKNINEIIQKISKKFHSTFSAVFHKELNIGSKTDVTCSEETHNAVS